LLLVDADGNEVMRGTFVEFTTNGVTVNLEWIGAAAAYLVTAIFGGGTKYEAWVGSVALGDVGSLADVGWGFAADVVRGVATWGSRDVGEPGGTLSLGMAHRNGGQYALERSYGDALTDALNRLRLFEGSLFHCRYNTPARGEGSVTAWSGTGFTLKVTTGAFNSTGLLMAERFGDVGSRLALVSSAIATGNADYSLDWNPQYVEHLISQTVASGSVNDNQKAGTIGIHSVTVDGEFSNEVSGENGSATTNEQSLSDNQLIVVGHTGTTVAAGATTLGTAKYSVNYTTAPGTAMVWPSLAVEVGKATGGGGDYVTAEFEASITGGAVPLTVQFVDLSAGTNAIAGWLWDFGDGTFSVERNPLKVYMVGGEFGVSLTVTDGTLSDTESKTAYILALQRAAREIIVGPYLMRVIADGSVPATHRGPDEADGGYMEGGLGLGALRLNADPEVPAGSSGEVVVYMDAASGNFKVIRPDETTGTITIS
jgi:PKD repeat protein